MMCARMAKETLTRTKLFLYQKSKTLNYNNGSRAQNSDGEKERKERKKTPKNGVQRRKRRGKSAKKKK
jgi:hypothetical protein